MARVIPIPVGPIGTGGQCRGLVHVVQKGDTLYELGKQYHVSVTQLMFANPFVDVYNLQIGDELCIPSVIQPRRRAESMGSGMPQGMPPRRAEEKAEEMPLQREMPLQGEIPERMGNGMPMENMGREILPGDSWNLEPSAEMEES